MRIEDSELPPMDHERRRIPWGKILLGTGAGIAVFLLAVAITFPPFIRGKMMTELGEEEYARFQEFYHGEFEIPGEWREVEPFSPGLIQASSDFDEVRSRLKYKQVDPASLRKQDSSEDLVKVSSLSETDRIVLQSDLEKYSDLLQALQSFVHHPDYEMDAFPVLEGTIVQSFGGVTSMTQLLLLEATLAVESGDWGLAVENIETCLWVTERHPGSSLIAHMLGIVVTKDSAQTILRVAPDWDDEPTGLELLRTMNEVDRRSPWDSLEDPRLIDRVGGLRNMIRNGYDWEIPERMTGEDLMWRGMEWMTEHHTRDSSLSEVESLMMSGLSRFGILRERLFAKHQNNFEGVPHSAIEARDLLNSARLGMAKKILELRGEEIPEYSDGFPQELFHEPVRHPLAGELYRWDEDAGRYLSGEPSAP